MGKIFGISDLPVAKPFPSFDFGKTEMIERGGTQYTEPAGFKATTTDVFVQKTLKNNLKTQLAKFFQRKHTKV